MKRERLIHAFTYIDICLYMPVYLVHICAVEVRRPLRIEAASHGVAQTHGENIHLRRSGIVDVELDDFATIRCIVLAEVSLPTTSDEVEVIAILIVIVGPE